MENENSFEEKELQIEESVDPIVLNAEQSEPLDDTLDEAEADNNNNQDGLNGEPVLESVLEPVALSQPNSLSESEGLSKEKKRKRRKAFKVLYIILLCIVGFATVVSMFAGMVYMLDAILFREEVIDIDDSFKLEDLSDDDIIDKNEYFISNSNKFITNGFDYSDADYDYDVYDRAECYFEATNFNGVKTISATGAPESKVTFVIKSELTSLGGNAKIVITSESEILATLELNETTIQTITCEDDEQIFVKVIGEDASFNVTVIRKITGVDENPDL